MIGFIGRRLSDSHTGRVSKPAITIATAGVAAGLAVMLLTVCVTLGFKTDIHGKVRQIGGDLNILNTSGLQQGASEPLTITRPAIDKLIADGMAQSANRVALKSGCLKTDSAFIGIQLAGIEQADGTDSTLMPKPGEIIISELQAARLNLGVGDRVMAYFFDQTVKARRFTISGTYRTNLEYLDNVQAYADYETVHTLAALQADQCHFVRVFSSATPLDMLAHVRQQVECTPANHPTVVAIQDLHPQVFSWLSLLDLNVWIILGLMLCVSGFTMASGLLILILERTQMIGLMKALGARFSTLRHIFLYIAAVILVRGMVIGNALALLIAFVQRQWHVVRLNPADYYVDAVPVVLPWMQIALLNACTMALTILVLMVPTYIIGRISPVKAMRFD